MQRFEMESEPLIVHRKHILLSQLSQDDIEYAILSYSFNSFSVKKIRKRLENMYDIMIDTDGDSGKILGYKIRKTLSSLEKKGYVKRTRKEIITVSMRKRGKWGTNEVQVGYSCSRCSLNTFIGTVYRSLKQMTK